MLTGKVKFFNQNKAFGFIIGDDGQEYFVHQTGLSAGVTLSDGVSVKFETEEGERGLKAVNVHLRE